MTEHHTALLVMDVQNGIVSRFAKDESTLTPIVTAVAAARAANIPVMFVRVAFRPGFAEVSPNNKSFSAIAGAGGMTADDDLTQVHASVAPRDGEPVITKRRVSAFSGSDLEVILRAQGIDTLVLCGIATSGVVLSTLREAADKDYRITVLADACLDADPEVHRVLTEKVFPRQADVLSAADWIKGLASSNLAN
nr:isochorismatase family cysteine hydrolase [Alicyclobacillus sp. ALC3]